MEKLFQNLTGLACAVMFASTVQASTIVLSGQLTASQVVDGGGSTSTATGFATVTIDTVLMTITTDLSWAGLTGNTDRSHMHDAPAGVSRLDPPNDRFFHEVLPSYSNDPPLNTVVPADCIVPINEFGCMPPTGSVHNVLNLSDPSTAGSYDNGDFADIINIALTNGFYIDLHTEQYPSGEIRGQVTATPEPATDGLVMSGVLALGMFRGRGRRPGR